MRLRMRLWMLWSLAIVATGVAVTVSSSLLQAHALRSALELRGETLARALASRAERVSQGGQEPAAQPARTGLRGRLRTVIAGLWQEDGLLAAEILSSRGELLTGQRFAREENPLRVVYPLRAPAPTSAAPTSAVPTSAVPPAPRAALVRVELSRARVEREVAKLWRRLPWTSAILLLAGSLLAALVALSSTRPLASLAAAASRLAAGDPHATIDGRHGGSEVRALAGAFDTMRRAVAEREARLQQQNQHLEQVIEAREALTHMIVHDLKNPVATVRAALDALRAGLSSDDDRELLALTRQRADQALQLIGDLLDVGRLEAGQLVPRREPLEARQLARCALEACAAEAQAAGVPLRLAIAADLSLRADRALLERVLVNLLANALRHGRPVHPGHPEEAPAIDEVDEVGEVDEVDEVDGVDEVDEVDEIDGVDEVDEVDEIVLSAVAEPAAPGTGSLVRFTVEDAGPGIAPSDRTTIFDKFSQLARGGARRGTGLGLAFCKLAVEAHGGRIWVEDGTQRGSRFCFVIPA